MQKYKYFAFVVYIRHIKPENITKKTKIFFTRRQPICSNSTLNDVLSHFQHNLYEML